MSEHPAQDPPRYARLPGGQHGLTPELVSADQLARLHAAMVEAVAARGYLETTVEDVLGRAGVSRRTFYERFANKQDCLIATLDVVLSDWLEQGALAYQATDSIGREDPSRDRLRAGMLALFARVLSDPLGARLVFVEALNCGEPGLRRLEQALDGLTQRVLALFTGPDGAAQIPDSQATVIVGGVLEIITSRIRHGRTEELLGLAEPLVSWMLSYRSESAAITIGLERELARRGLSRGGGAGIDGGTEADMTPALWRDSSARPVVLEDPRARILRAAAEIVREHGYGALSTSAIVRAARVSHHTFRTYFKTKDDAFIAAHLEGSRETIAYTLRFYQAESEWPAAVRAGLNAELRFLAARPEFARIGFLEVYAAGPRALEQRERELQLFTAGLQPGFAGAPVSRHPVVAEAIAGGIYQLLRQCVLHQQPAQLPALLTDTVYAALAPFIGAEAACIAATPLTDAHRTAV